MIMNMQTNDARFAQMLAQGMFSPSELIVQGDTRQYVMHSQNARHRCARNGGRLGDSRFFAKRTCGEPHYLAGRAFDC